MRHKLEYAPVWLIVSIFRILPRAIARMLGMVIAFLVTLGVFSYRGLAVDLFPKADPATVNVGVRLPGATPEEMITGVGALRASNPSSFTGAGVGIAVRKTSFAISVAEWERVIAVNLTGVFLGCQVVGRRMLARRRGRIVNIASIAGQIGLTGTVAYAASKGGVVMLTRALAVEWAPHNVRVNAIAPSWFESNIGDLIHREPGYAERAMRRVPAGRMGTPDELIGAVLYLASDASTMVTGHVLAVDGGTLAS